MRVAVLLRSHVEIARTKWAIVAFYMQSRVKLSPEKGAAAAVELVVVATTYPTRMHTSTYSKIAVGIREEDGFRGRNRSLLLDGRAIVILADRKHRSTVPFSLSLFPCFSFTPLNP